MPEWRHDFPYLGPTNFRHLRAKFSRLGDLAVFFTTELDAVYNTGIGLEVQGQLTLLAPNDVHMSYRTANFQTLHFKYLIDKYTY